MAREEVCILTNMCMVYDENRILVQDRMNPDWPGITFPGGHVEPKESFVESVIREVKEETGLDNLKLLSDGIYGIQVLTVDPHIKRGKYVPSHVHLDCCFLFEADEEEMIRIKEDENSGVKWIDINEACIVTNEEKMKPIYKKLNDKLSLIK